MTPAPKSPADGGVVVWLAVRPNGNPEMGEAKSPAAVPPRAGWWCRCGDAAWTRTGAVSGSATVGKT